jgi:hypothetical protein
MTIGVGCESVVKLVWQFEICLRGDRGWLGRRVGPWHGKETNNGHISKYKPSGDYVGA